MPNQPHSMTCREASATAQAYIIRQNQENPFHPDYEYTVGAPEEYFDCWYFGYRVVNLRGVPEAEQDIFVGAPGFTVSKADNTITVVAHHQRRELAQRENAFHQATLVAEELLSKELSLQALRKYFKLPLPALVALKRSLKETGLTYPHKKSLLVSQLMREAELLP